MKSLLYIISTSLLIAIFYCNCRDHKKEPKEEFEALIDSTNTSWKNQKLKLTVIQKKRSLNIDSVSFDETKKVKKIISFFDADCSVCISELKDWQFFLDSVTNRRSSKVEVDFIATSADSLQLYYWLNETVKFSYPVYFDPQGQFIVQNEIPFDKNFQTFILDENNRVVFIGCPIKNDYLKQAFLEKLNKLS